MVDEHGKFVLPPEEVFEANIKRILEDGIIASLTAQKDEYLAAERMVAEPNQHWFGGYGGAGRLVEASRTFLGELHAEIAVRRQTQERLVQSLEEYAAALRKIAASARAHDRAVADRFNQIARDLEGI